MEARHKTGANGAVSKKPSPELQQLEIFAGHWEITGYNISLDNGQDIPVEGEDHYVWLPGNFFLVSNWQHSYDGGQHKGISIMGYDDETGKLFTHNFDNLGYERKYFLENSGTTWTFTGDNERAIREYNPEGDGYVENWQVNKNGEWLPLCTMRGSRGYE
jgi:hypothetical protein